MNGSFHVIFYARQHPAEQSQFSGLSFDGKYSERSNLALRIYKQTEAVQLV